MRILQLRFKNLNSLLGEWLIDFADPRFCADGIFAITGPTGAGKTTILDAICLALYGRTPRLERIGKSGNEIMSRQSGECFAELEFVCGGRHLRCFWGQHKARKSPLGELQPPRHEIADGATGEIFASSLKAVAEQVEAATGMNFERFVRSVMLAQGDFAVFLQAPANERAPILEQITGTEIYSRISMQVHERWRSASESLAALQSQASSLQILDSEQEQQLKAGMLSAQQQIGELNLELEHSARQLAWLTEAQTLARQQAALPQLQSSLDASAAQQKQAAQRLETATSSLQEALPVLQEVRGLDGQIKAIVDSHTQLLAEINTQLEQQNTLERQYRQQIKTCVQALNASQTKLNQAHTNKSVLDAQLQGLQQRLAQTLNGGLLREYRERHRHLLREMAYLQKIAQLEDERQKLIAGNPCPLCGATEHPFASGAVPRPDATELRIQQLGDLIQQAEQLEHQCSELTQAQTGLERQVTTLTSQQQLFSSRQADAQVQLDKVLQGRAVLQERIKQQKQRTDASLAQLRAQRQQLFGQRDPEQEQQRLSQESSAADNAYRRATQAQQERLLAVNTATAQLQSTQERLASLPQAATTNQQELLQLRATQQQRLQELNSAHARAAYQLEQNSKIAQQLELKLQQVAQQQDECERWRALHLLIGSADGKKYRNFAQGLSFELMVNYANLQLQKMSDRYLLVCDSAQPLELKVLDNYQAGEVRSTKNLSGGESFIVSLALALGLSSMASDKFRVDSLFLDEGFGSLDEEALDVALDTLANLQQEGKLIGIISHVPALQERIATQIQVVPMAGGKSRILGYNCKLLKNQEPLQAAGECAPVAE